MHDRYEYVMDYDGTNYLFSAGKGHYVTPHIHREYEIGYVISNSMDIRVKKDVFHLREGDVWLINPFESHEPNAANASAPNDFVQLKVPFSFLKTFFPDTYGISFDTHLLSAETVGEENAAYIRGTLRRAALAYFKREAFYQLQCSSEILLLFKCLLESVPYTVSDGAQMASMDLRNRRMQRISRMIEENFDVKLLLSDIAEKEHLSLQYLSRFFKKNWGLSFQEYLTLYRCSRAREYLLTSNYSIADISLICGFSDPKYLRSGFRRVFGTEPSAMRRSADGTADRAAGRERSATHLFRTEEAIRLLEHIGE